MIRKVCIVLLAFALLSSFVLSASADKMIIVFEEYTEYIEYIESEQYKEQLDPDVPFVTYGQIALLGEFDLFIFGPKTPYAYSYTYYLQQDFGKVHFNINTDVHNVKEARIRDHRDRKHIPPDDIAFEDVSVKDVVDTSHMLYLTERPNSEFEQSQNYYHYYYLQCGEVYYCYSLDRKVAKGSPRLDAIEWMHEGRVFSIELYGDLSAESNTLIYRLLNYETAEIALAEIISFMDATAKVEEEELQRKAFLEKYKPFMVGAGIGIALLVTAATVLPIVIVKRKKKKAERASGE